MKLLTNSSSVLLLICVDSRFAHYSYQKNVPFLARNFGTFGVHFGYDLFDGRRKRVTLRERDARLAQAEENLA
jgi:hypothetical protein